MAKVFTITEGLENMGALKTGGQGSVYKARRHGEIVTAVKLLPTPIHNESIEDRHFASFQNEVSKLKKVNEKPNPNVVRILSSGITETGSFPFIEMEYIEGPDLEELLKPPHDPVFSIKEAIRVAENLSNALAHCHRIDVKHGDIKTNNIKYNIHAAHYVLLDFGMAVMSDEQRRTSLRQAGAIEFMAPEQNEGHMLFQTDVYSFGVVLYELLAGVVPFPLNDRGETSRNAVMVAHMEQAVPDLLQAREAHLPEEWTEEKRSEELQVPEWLIKTIYRCLEKKPQDRFANGIELYNQVVYNRISSFADHDLAAKALGGIQKENEKLRAQNKLLRDQLSERRFSLPEKGKLITWVPLLLLFLVSAAFLYYYLQNRNQGANEDLSENLAQPVTPHTTVGTFRVLATRAYFHNEPDASARRNAFMVPSNDLVTGIEEKNGFIYTSFTNSRGQTSNGWLKKTDLQRTQSGVIDSSTSSRQISAQEIEMQLEDAQTFLVNNNPRQALFIYRNLAAMEIAEAMFHYGNLGLKRFENNLDCTTAMEWINRAANKGFPPAKRTMGFLFLFADNAEILKANEYDNCTYERNVFRGTGLLKEARAAGDSLAAKILEEAQL
ncbi:MAG: protein kinase [Flavisolibacter sp.]|nr:protein kinase [Flavisolibacter sp.]